VIAGQTLMIEGKSVRCPPTPLYYVKAGGVVVEINQSHYEAELIFDRCVSNDRELWRMNSKGYWILLRRMMGGLEKQHGKDGKRATDVHR
jgi:hypothetical protein